MNKENMAELTEKQRENKKEDKKAFKKFIITLVAAFFIGICLGFGSSVSEGILRAFNVKEILFDVLRNIAIYGGYVVTTVLLIVSVVLYKKSRAEYTAWDEEEEEVLTKI